MFDNCQRYNTLLYRPNTDIIIEISLGEIKMEYVKLTEDRIDEFIRLRINQLREEGAKEDIDLVPALKDYYNRHMAYLHACSRKAPCSVLNL